MTPQFGRPILIRTCSRNFAWFLNTSRNDIFAFRALRTTLYSLEGCGRFGRKAVNAVASGCPLLSSPTLTGYHKITNCPQLSSLILNFCTMYPPGGIRRTGAFVSGCIVPVFVLYNSTQDPADCSHAHDVWERARVGHVAPGPTSWLSMATMAVDGRQVTVLAT